MMLSVALFLEVALALFLGPWFKTLRVGLVVESWPPVQALAALRVSAE